MVHMDRCRHKLELMASDVPLGRLTSDRLLSVTVRARIEAILSLIRQDELSENPRTRASFSPHAMLTDSALARWRCFASTARRAWRAAACPRVAEARIGRLAGAPESAVEVRSILKAPRKHRVFAGKLPVFSQRLALAGPWK